MLRHDNVLNRGGLFSVSDRDPRPKLGPLFTGGEASKGQRAREFRSNEFDSRIEDDDPTYHDQTSSCGDDEPSRHDSWRDRKTHLVLIRRSHLLDQIFRLGLGDGSSVGDDLHEGSVNLARHVGSVPTHVKVSVLLLEEFVDLVGMLAKSMLYVDLLRPLPRERGDQLERIAERFTELLR